MRKVESPVTLIISEQHKYIFISVPKTGSTSIVTYLASIDPTADWCVVRDGDRERRVHPHTSAADLRSILGPKFDDYFSFAFVREPHARFLSLYSFYRDGRALQEPFAKQSRRWWARTGMRVLLARTLPFWLWSLVYPYRSCSSFLCDRNGRVLVTEIGRLESLESDMPAMLERAGLDAARAELPSLNATTARESDAYPNWKWLQRLLDIKFRDDREFYTRVAAGSH